MLPRTDPTLPRLEQPPLPWIIPWITSFDLPSQPRLEQVPRSHNPKGHFQIKSKTKVMMIPAVAARTTEEGDIGVEEEEVGEEKVEEEEVEEIEEEK